MIFFKKKEMSAEKKIKRAKFLFKARLVGMYLVGALGWGSWVYSGVLVSEFYSEATSKSTVVFERVQAAETETEEAPVVEAQEPEITDCDSAIEYTPDAPKILMGRIMKAESGNRSNAANKVSTARGCFQFIIGTWELRGKELWGKEFYSKNVYNPKDNVELATYVINRYGTSDWNASRAVWSK
jgi:hypothetical protein